ncbi:MAG: mechanosensitive ion channel family protein [Clostridiales bacterium]|jgi:miniconductance mechanosensitive channel|nr:mechanosensitive ion channel family protein [Clostridiales bacterium]
MYLIYHAILKVLTALSPDKARFLSPLMTAAPFFSCLLTAAAVFLICLCARACGGVIFDRLIYKMLLAERPDWAKILRKNKFPPKMTNILIPVSMFLLQGTPGDYPASFPRELLFLYSASAVILSVIVAMLLIRSLIKCSIDIYALFPISKTHHIKGILQILEIAAYVICLSAGVSVLLGKSLYALLAGLGALTAVGSLIFKDSILGLVAGLQLSSNDMVRIGDWIEMEKYSADGTVVDLSLTTVKIQNFDQSVTSLPAYALVSDAFINWRNMEISGSRRMKRSVYLNAADFRFLREDELEKFREYSAGDKPTNIGAFRAFALDYLKKHPSVRQDKFIMTRLLECGEYGAPLQVYAFAATADTKEYEEVQSEIIEYLYAKAEYFGIRAYQKPFN